MKLADLRALPTGAPLLAGPAAEPVVLAAISPAGAGRRTATARVLTATGDPVDVLPRQLTPAPPARHPDAVAERPGLTGHTITVERITARIWPLLGLVRRGAVGQLAAIERQDGRLGKVCCLHGDLCGGSIETAAYSYAQSYGAVYVPAALPGEAGIWDERSRRFLPSVYATAEQAREALFLLRFDYIADEEDPAVLSVREFHPAPGAGR